MLCKKGLHQIHISCWGLLSSASHPVKYQSVTQVGPLGLAPVTLPPPSVNQAKEAVRRVVGKSQDDDGDKSVAHSNNSSGGGVSKRALDASSAALQHGSYLLGLKQGNCWKAVRCAKGSKTTPHDLASIKQGTHLARVASG